MTGQQLLPFVTLPSFSLLSFPSFRHKNKVPGREKRERGQRERKGERGERQKYDLRAETWINEENCEVVEEERRRMKALVVLVVCVFFLVAVEGRQSVRNANAAKRQLLQQSYEKGISLLKSNPLAKPYQSWAKSPAPQAKIVVTPSSPAAEKDWESCVKLPILNETCVELYIYTNNLTAGVKLIIQNHTVINEVLIGNKVCLNDETLLELLTYIPVLLPFKPILDYLIEV